MAFPSDFLWGTATSSYQIEGAETEDGRGECIWTRFSRIPGKVKGGATGAVACDHYHRYREDVALMRSLGFGAYRFSISWPRVQPLGTGATNPAGLDFYDRLVDTLLAGGLQPFPTLYHWDLPQALEDKGGWTNRDMPKWFADYTDLVTRRLGSRVGAWITLNEPWCTAMLGYYYGIHAPGLTDETKAFQAAHQTHLSHAAAMNVIRQNAPTAKAGTTLNIVPQLPASDDPRDVAMARLADGTANRWFLDPVFKGEYPADVLEDLNSRGILDGIDVSEVKQAAVPMDFLGINYYMRWLIAHDPASRNGRKLIAPRDGEHTAMGWEVYPQAFTDALLRVHHEYGPKAIYVTECGAAYADPDTLPDANAAVLDDPQRVAFFKGYLSAAAEAIAGGVPLKGFFAWSLLDNFEWAEGYDKRFGIVHVDYQTQKRTPKQSACYLQQVAQTGKL
jgi:beta-glucosidase